MFLDPVDVSITQIILMTGLVNQQAGPSMERNAQISAASSSSRAKRLDQSCSPSPGAQDKSWLAQVRASFLPKTRPSPAPRGTCSACGSDLAKVNCLANKKSEFNGLTLTPWAASPPFTNVSSASAQMHPKSFLNLIPSPRSFSSGP